MISTHARSFSLAAKRENRLPAFMRRAALVASTTLALAVVQPVTAQFDDFNDGNDNGWVHYDPLSVLFGPMATYTVVNGAYRITAEIPPVQDAGPGRAGSYRTNLYTDFAVSADLVAWPATDHQLFGVMGRIGDVGLGTTVGYMFSYDSSSGTNGGDFDIVRITNEGGSSIETGNSGLHLVRGQSYRFVFVGKGPYLDGYIYALPNTATPVLHVKATDATYSQGVCGLIVADNPDNASIVQADATFDNYLATDREPLRLQIAKDALSGAITISWPISYPEYTLQSSATLGASASWRDESSFPNEREFNFISDGSEPSRYYRLRR